MILLCASRTRAKRLAEDLRDHELRAFYSEDADRIVQRGEIMLLYGSAHRGYEYPLIKFLVISESDIFGKEKKKRKRSDITKVRRSTVFQSFLLAITWCMKTTDLAFTAGLKK